MTEKMIIAGCQKNKPKAQVKLFEMYAPLLRGVAYRYTGNKIDAEDVVQESFLVILSKIRSFKYEGSFEGWMRRIVISKAIDYYNNKKRRRTIELNEDLDAAEEETTEEHITKKEDVKFSDFSKEEIIEMVNELPEKYRMVFNLYVIDGFSHKEIAAKMGIGETTSKSQLARAKQKLQERVLQKVNKRKIS